MTAAIPLSQVHISEKNKFEEGIKSIPLEDIETLPSMRIDYLISDNRLQSRAVVSYQESAKDL